MKKRNSEGKQNQTSLSITGNKDLLKKKFSSRRSSSSSNSPYFNQKSGQIARSVSASKNPYKPVYSIPMNSEHNNNNKNYSQQDIESGNLIKQTNTDYTKNVSSISKFRGISRVAGHVASSAATTMDASYDVLKQVESAMSYDRNNQIDIPNRPAVYEPPSTADLKTLGKLTFIYLINCACALLRRSLILLDCVLLIVYDEIIFFFKPKVSFCLICVY